MLKANRNRRMERYSLVVYQCKENLSVVSSCTYHFQLWMVIALDGNSPVGIVTHYRLDGLGIEY
jgi:hypothetical protein